MRALPFLSLLLLSRTPGLPAQGTRLSDTTRSFIVVDAPAVALTHVRVIDGTGSIPTEDQTIVIQSGNIASVGPSTRTPVPPGARVLDLSGRTVIPGFVGLHDHMYYNSGSRTNEMSTSGPRLFLAGGVTTIRTAGANFPTTS